jgi:hypothetical protein
MNISDKYLDKKISETKYLVDYHRKCDDGHAAEQEIMLHIIETYKALPKTADGARVKPGDTVYKVTMTGMIVWDQLSANTEEGNVVGYCYSTREAAEAAKASEK